MPRAWPLSAALCCLTCSACSTASDYSVATGRSSTGPKSTTVGGGTPSGASTSGGTSATGSSSSSGGSTTGAVCGAAFLEGWYDGGETASDCPSGQVELKGRLDNLCDFGPNGAAPIDVSFTASDAFNPEVTATTKSCGVYYFCLDAGTSITPTFIAQGFEPLTIATMLLDATPGVGATGYTGVDLLCTSVGESIFGSLTPPANMSDAVVAVYVVGVPELDAGCSGRAGWSFALEDRDGGAIAAGAVFADGFSYDQAVSSTTDEGQELLYNIDPSIGFVRVVGTFVGGGGDGDGGGQCSDLASDAPYWPFTGDIPVFPATLTQTPYVVGF